MEQKWNGKMEQNLQQKWNFYSTHGVQSLYMKVIQIHICLKYNQMPVTLGKLYFLGLLVS